MKIVSLIRSAILSKLDMTPPGRGDLRVGDKLVGRVIEVKSNRKALIDFGRFRALAELEFSVKKGEVINVKVIEKGVPLRLSLNGVGPVSTGGAKKTVTLGEFPSKNLLKELRSQIKDPLYSPDSINKGKSVPLEVKNAIIKINSHFQPIDISKNIAQLSSQLKTLTEESGIFYEKKIEKIIETLLQSKKNIVSKEINQTPELKNVINKDLKPNLLILRDFLDGKDFMSKISGTKNLEGIRNTVEKLLTEILARQSDTGFRPIKSESIQVYTYLLPLKEVEQDARIRIYYPKKNRSKSKDGFRVSLLLIMDQIGQIRTDFFLIEKNLDISFFVSEGNIKKCLDDHLEGLRESLNDNFNNLTVRVVVSEKKIDEFEFEDLIPLSSGLIDVKV